MRKFQLLLDGSESSEVAAKHAISMASKCDAEIVPVNVIDARRFRTPGVIETVRAQIDAYLKDLTETAQACCNVTISVGTAKTIIANPVKDILAETRSTGADLIVMGAAGYTRGRINDIATAVLKQAKTNVLLVRDQLKNDRFYKKILMPTLEPDNVSKYATGIADRFDADLVGCSVVNTREMVLDERIVYLPEAASGRHHLGERVKLSKTAVNMEREALLNRARGDVDNLLEPARSIGIRTESVALDGSPAEEIPAFAAKEQFDLMVLGYRNKGRFSRILSGNLSENIALAAPCSVFAVKTS